MTEAERALADSLLAKLGTKPFMLPPMVEACATERAQFRHLVAEWIRDLVAGNVHPGGMWNWRKR